MNNKTLIVGGIIGLLIIGELALFFQSQNQYSESTPVNQNTLMERVPSTERAPSESPSASSPTQSDGEVKTFTIDAQNFSFSMKEIRVKKGDRVKIVLVNKQGFHDWVIDEFNAKTKQINAGETDTIEFTADQVGTFQFYCSIGQHRAMGMVGNLIVEE